MVGWFNGMLLLSAKRPRPLGRWEDSQWETIRRTIQEINNTIRGNGWVASDIITSSIKNSSIWEESITRYVSRVCIDRGRIWKGDILIADIEELKNLDASEIYPRRINAQEVLITQGRRLQTPSRRWYRFVNKRLRIPGTHSKAETNRRERRSQWRTSRRIGRASTNEKWWAESMECYCYLRNVHDLLADGKTPYERRFVEPFKGPVIPFGAMVG